MTTKKTELEEAPTNGILKRAQSFGTKAYHLAWCNNDGSISPVKVVISLAVIGYIGWFNPWLILAFVELFIIFAFFWFMIKLLVGQDNVVSAT